MSYNVLEWELGRLNEQVAEMQGRCRGDTGRYRGDRLAVRAGGGHASQGPNPNPSPNPTTTNLTRWRRCRPRVCSCPSPMALVKKRSSFGGTSYRYRADPTLANPVPNPNPSTALTLTLIDARCRPACSRWHPTCNSFAGHPHEVRCGEIGEDVGRYGRYGEISLRKAVPQEVAHSAN